ncbi:MAG: 30S ribosomal protein S15 [Planctomycetota bacterium]|jgi:small subunit ribosomal protein S15
MVMTKERRKEVVESFRVNDTDTGSPEVQVALLTERITYMTEHMKANGRDFHSQRGLLRMVNRRNKLLKYLRREASERYKALIERLGLRK